MTTKAEWEQKLKNSQMEADDELSPSLLEAMGIHVDDSIRIFDSLWNKCVKTWGDLIDLKNEESAIEKAGDKGTRIWNAVQEYKEKAATAAAKQASMWKPFEVKTFDDMGTKYALRYVPPTKFKEAQ